MQGEVQIPDSVSSFFEILYAGGNKDVSTRKRRLVESTSADVIYSCSGGKLLPGKRMSLGIALKSMTGSKSVVNLMNRFGHCASNEKIRRIDIGMESTLNESNDIVPDNIVKIPSLCTGRAWDNFDVNMETLSGANSIHHTCGICY